MEIRIDTNRTHLLLVTPDGKHNSALKTTHAFNGLTLWDDAKGTWGGRVTARYWEEKPVHRNGVAWLRGRYGATNAPESAIVYEETWTLRPPDGVTVALTRRNPGAVRAKMPGATLFIFNLGGGAKPLAPDRFGSRRFYDFGHYRLEFESDTGLELQYHPDAQRLYLGGLTLEPGAGKTQTVTLRVAPGSAAGRQWNSIQEQQRLLAQDAPDLAVVPAVDLSLDDPIHIGADINRLGRRLAQAMHALAGGKGGGPLPLQVESVRMETNPVNSQVDVVVRYRDVAGSLGAQGGRPAGDIPDMKALFLLLRCQ